MVYIYHIVRESSNASKFKDIIQQSIKNLGGNRMFICSGFIQEAPPKFSTFCDYDSKGFSFENNPGMEKIKEIHIQGIYNNLWRNKFDEFVKKIDQKYPGKIKSNLFKNRTHAKIFSLFKDETPLIEIIGSSNFTRLAYGTSNKFNIEADLVIFNTEKIVKNDAKQMFDEINNIIFNDEKQEFSSSFRINVTEDEENHVISEMKKIIKIFFGV